MKIVIDGRSAFFYKGSGIGNYSLEIIKNLFKINKNNLIDIYTNAPKNTRNLPFWKLAQNSIQVNSECDIFLNPHNGIGIPEKKSFKLITTLHDIIPSKLPETVSDIYLKIYNENILKIIDQSDYILTVSNFSKNDIAKTFNVDKKKIFVTHLAPSNIYYPLNKSHCIKFLKTKYNIDYNYVLYVGSFSPRKNILTLIEAFSHVYNKHKNLKLIIIGTKGKSYDNYISQCTKLNVTDKIVFTDFIETSDLPFFYNCSSCFIYPSIYEGFGLPPLEAMACGIPTIASNVTSIPEVLGNAPMYINPYSVSDISEKLDLVLSDPHIKTSLILKSLKHSKNFSWEKTSLETLNIMTKIKGANIS